MKLNAMMDVFALLLHNLYPFPRNISVIMISPRAACRDAYDIMKSGLANVDVVPDLLAVHCTSGYDFVPQL